MFLWFAFSPLMPFEKVAHRFAERYIERIEKKELLGGG